MEIKYLKHNEIDFNKWDECISNSLNGIVYAYSWYLDIVGGDWEALVEGDYSIVFPLVKSQKYNINYLYQPIFTQQLGAFSSKMVDETTLKRIISSIPKKYKYQEFNLNILNQISNSEYKVKDRVTFHLDLIQPYFSISSNFSSYTKRNISKSIALGIKLRKGLPVADFMAFYKANLPVELKVHEYDKLQAIIEYSVEKNLGEIYAAYTIHDELCSAIFIIKSNGKIIDLAAASSLVGKANKAMFAIIDHLINKYSDTLTTFDFEGSNIEGVANFYSGFGSKPCIYKHVVINNLPWYIKLFKR